MKAAVVKALTQRLEYIIEEDSLEKNEDIQHTVDAMSDIGYPKAFSKECLKRRNLDAGATANMKVYRTVCESVE